MPKFFALMKDAWVLFVFFCLLFSFKIPVFVNSAVFIAILYFFVFALRFPIHILVRTIKKKTVAFQFLIYFLIVFLVLVQAIGHQTFDFYRVRSAASSLIVFISVILFYSSSNILVESERFSDRLYFVARSVFVVFSIQAVLIFFAALSTDFLSLIQLFQAEGESERAGKYDGIRGLALAGGQFFSLSAAFAFAQPICVYYILGRNRVSLGNTLLFLLIFLAGLTAGRTAIMGTISSVLLVIFYIVFSSIRRTQSLIFLSQLISLFVLALFIIFLLFSDNELLLKFSGFAFEYIANYSRGEGVSTESTSILDDMYWRISLNDFLLGDGRYTEIDGTPYMGTDAGYMRNILLFGGLGSFVLWVSQIHLMRLVFWSHGSGGDEKLLGVVLLFLIFLLHYKGEVIFHLVSIQTLLFMISVPLLLPRVR